MPSTLDQIVAARRRSVDAAKSAAGLRGLERAAAAHVPRGFAAGLRKSATDGIAVIAELKKASPSRGLIRADFPVGDLARELEQAGASALSVLTEPDFFQGSLDNLRNASAATRLPCLRKDFIVDEFQMLEARANSADAVLLIAAALGDAELRRFHRAARDSDLDVLCEVHDREELSRALDAGCEIIGVNSRDLKTFEVNLETALRLAPEIPSRCLRVAESGIRSFADVERLRGAGFEAFLVGESLMKAPRPGDELQALLHAGAGKLASRR